MDSGPSPTLRRILAIDDDPVSLAVIAVLLEAEGCEVLPAAGGQEALELLSGGEPPDCILADLRMPGLAGPELARSLRRIVPDIVLLAMSASPPAQVEGYDGILKKPLSPEAIRDSLASLSAARSAVREDAASDGDDSALLDEAVFGRLRRAMSAAGIEEVARTFLQDAVQRLEAMRSADAESVCRLAHTIKGGASMIGAIQVARIASDVEAGIDHFGERQRKLDELDLVLHRTEVILIGRLKA